MAIGVILQAYSLIDDTDGSFVSIQVSSDVTGSRSGVVQKKYRDGSQRTIRGISLRTARTLTIQKLDVPTSEWIRLRQDRVVVLRDTKGTCTDVYLKDFEKEEVFRKSEGLAYDATLTVLYATVPLEGSLPRSV